MASQDLPWDYEVRQSDSYFFSDLIFYDASFWLQCYNHLVLSSLPWTWEACSSIRTSALAGVCLPPRDLTSSSGWLVLSFSENFSNPISTACPCFIFFKVWDIIWNYLLVVSHLPPLQGPQFCYLQLKPQTRIIPGTRYVLKKYLLNKWVNTVTTLCLSGFLEHWHPAKTEPSLLCLCVIKIRVLTYMNILIIIC